MADEEAFVDDESASERAFDYDRTVALSDGVFAIALTLLVLSLTVPSLAPPHQGLLGTKLLHKRDEFISYGISFAVIAGLWVRHHQLFRTLTSIDRTVTALNLAYLAFVALLPFPTRILGAYGEQPSAIVFYAATVAVLSLLAGLIRLHVLRTGLVAPDRRHEVTRHEHWAFVPAVFLGSIPIAFVSTTLAKLFWLLLLVRPARSRSLLARLHSSHGNSDT